jgi:hypothetical protein
MTVNKERVELLCQALESGEYQQCQDQLRKPALFTGDWSYCALGVATRVALDNWQAPQWWTKIERDGFDYELWAYADLSVEIMEWYGFRNSDPLINLNDKPVTIAGANDLGNDFWTIAQALRATYLKDEE